MLCFSLICSGKLCFLLFHIAGCLTNTHDIIDHREVSGVYNAIKQHGGKNTVLALFSFLKGSGKALIFGQNLLRKSSVLLFVSPFSTVRDTESDKGNASGGLNQQPDPKITARYPGHKVQWFKSKKLCAQKK